MRTLTALTAGLAAAAALTVAVAAGVAADDEPRPQRVPAAVVVEDEGPGTETVPVRPPVIVEDEGPGTETVPVRPPVVVEDEGPGTETVPTEPRYACQDGVCDTYGESTEGPGTTADPQVRLFQELDANRRLTSELVFE